MKSNKYIFFVVALITAFLTYVAAYGLPAFDIKGANQMRFGIDIRGGVDAVFQPAEGEKPTQEQLETARAIIETRLNAKNITDHEVTIDKTNNTIIVRFPWKSTEKDFNPQNAITELGETAKLTFRDENGKVLVDGKHVVKSAAQYYPPSQGSDISGNVVELEFDEEGAKLFAEATKALIGKPIDIYMDEMLIQRATVQTEITDGKAVITHIETAQAAKELAAKITAGALPFKLVSKNHSTISPTLGSGALDVMVKAGAIAFLLVCLFMLLYYRLPGFVACIALLFQTVCQLLAISIPQYTITLPGIAGIILSIGMGVDANVIISERIKEELNLGKSLTAAIDAGFRKAFSAVADGNITVIICGIILMIFGSGSINSFAYTLIVGVILNFASGVTASRLMIRSLSNYKFLQKPFLFGARRAVQ